MISVVLTHLQCHKFEISWNLYNKRVYKIGDVAVHGKYINTQMLSQFIPYRCFWYKIVFMKIQNFLILIRWSLILSRRIYQSKLINSFCWVWLWLGCVLCIAYNQLFYWLSVCFWICWTGQHGVRLEVANKFQIRSSIKLAKSHLLILSIHFLNIKYLLKYIKGWLGKVTQTPICPA